MSRRPRLVIAIAAAATAAASVVLGVSADADQTGQLLGQTVTPQLELGSDSPCVAQSPPASFTHVIWIVMENHSYADIVGNSSAPYETSVANACASATDYHAVIHPSLPNYLAMTGGSTHGVRDDLPPASHPISTRSIFGQVARAGMQWRSYEESMSTNCELTSDGEYAVKHNPAAYYTAIASDCARWDVPSGRKSSGAFGSDLANGSLPAFSFVTPNLCHDTHDCSVATGDSWLKSWLPAIFASPSYLDGSTAVFLTWDEDDHSQGNQVPLIAMAPSIAPGTVVSDPFNHYSLLRTTEELLGLTTYVGSAATATSMRSELGL